MEKTTEKWEWQQLEAQKSAKQITTKQQKNWNYGKRDDNNRANDNK